MKISNKADEYVVENALVSGLLSLLLLSCLTLGLIIKMCISLFCGD